MAECVSISYLSVRPAVGARLLKDSDDHKRTQKDNVSQNPDTLHRISDHLVYESALYTHILTQRTLTILFFSVSTVEKI